MTNRRYAFTGPARPDIKEWEAVISTTLAHLPVPDEVRTGGAHGVDTCVAREALVLWPAARHVLYLPEGCWFNEECLSWPECVHERIAGGYMARNDALVLGATHVIGFPSHPGEVRRSGTWSTIRRARKLHLPTLIVPLSDPERALREHDFDLYI